MEEFRVTLDHSFPAPVGDVLRGFELSVAANEIVAILGPSGAGKTTILRRLAGLLPHGLEEEEGTSPLGTQDFVFLFQRPEMVPWRTLEGNAYLEVDVLGRNRNEAKAAAEPFFHETHLAPYRSLAPEEASAGMLQRAQLLRAAARPAAWYLLDEPLGAVDQPLRIELATELRRLLKERSARVVWVTHDALEAVSAADRVLVVAGRPLRVVHIHVVDYDRDTATTAPGIGRTREDEAARVRCALQELPESIRFPPVPAIGGDESTSAQKQLSRVARWSAASVPLSFFLLLWGTVVALHPKLAFFISTPTVVAEALLHEVRSGRVPSHVLITLREAIYGFLIALPAAIIVGFASTLTARLAAAIRPYLVGATAVPLFVLAPAFILWFGIGERMKVAIAAASAFPFIAQHVHDASVNAKGPLYSYLRRAGARTSYQYRYIVAPSALESAVHSIRPAVVAALLGAFLGEFIAAEAGIGYYIVFQASRFRIAEVIVGVIALFIVAIIVDALARTIARRHLSVMRIVSDWRRRSRSLD